jgi:hypothetical protein
MRALVVGAGLAGLTVAHQLALHSVPVTVLEASGQAGGKAGAHSENGQAREHGYHIFPKWYRNTRRICSRLGVRLVDFEQWHAIEPGGLSHPTTVRVPKTPADAWRALSAGPLPWHQTLLYCYFVVDMLAESLSRKAVLDQVSRVGLMRDRWYMVDAIPAMEVENVLKASAIPVYDMSAMTAKIISNFWLKEPSPFVSVLPGDLQSAFIEPYRAEVESSGVQILFGEKAEKLLTSNGRVTHVRATGPSGTKDHPADFVAVTTPLEVTRVLIDGAVQALDPKLGNFEHLQAAPMAALHLDLKTPLANTPREHVFLHLGHYGLSFIDLAKVWDPPPPRQTLSFIASNFIPLRDLSEQEQFDALFGEIQHYLGITPQDLQEWVLYPNVQTPLFINTIGAWHNRPSARSERIANLFFAGDWVRNPIDLACMEGAVSAGHQAAHLIGKAAGASIPRPLEPQTYPQWTMRGLKWGLAPAMLPVWLYSKFFSDPHPAGSQ